MSDAPAKKKVSGLTKPMKVSDDLEAIIGVSEASRPECSKLLWAYIKENNLQRPTNKQYFTPDKKMAKIFGKDEIRGFGMQKFLGAHLSPLDA
jgi:upstream activation factor subunit UAF30